jgi:hypothetical protein
MRPEARVQLLAVVADDDVADAAELLVLLHALGALGAVEDRIE